MSQSFEIKEFADKEVGVFAIHNLTAEQCIIRQRSIAFIADTPAHGTRREGQLSVDQLHGSTYFGLLSKETQGLRALWQASLFSSVKPPQPSGQVLAGGATHR